MPEHGGHCIFCACFTIASGNAYADGVFLTLSACACCGVKGSENIGDDDLEEARRHVVSWCAAKSGQRSCMSSGRNEVVAVAVCSFASNKEVARRDQTAVMIGR